MKYLVVTRADSNIESYTKVTLPIIESYSKEWEADFRILSHTPSIMTEDEKTHYRILEVQQLLDEYDRILCLDSDMIITKNCPNPFDEVPFDCVGTIYEDKGSRQQDRKKHIHNIQQHWSNVGWVSGYTNAGTFMLSNIHKNIFEPVNGEYYKGWGSVDVHLAYNIHKYNFKVHELSYKWNHMTMFSEGWNGSPNRFDSYIIHYAGHGIFDRNINSKVNQIHSDYKTIYNQ
jgi:lipopolysaccharide biosynthesis glycosyltransferase|tara:strand:+ start:2703 stop:3395 length:693 start_codon:yes stop_codon:yes gene_type:complete